MIAFDVFCKEIFLCRMGLAEAGHVLSISLTNLPYQEQASLIAIGKSKSEIEVPSAQSEAEKVERFTALMQSAIKNWAEESLTPPFQLEIRVVETDDLESISPAEELVADPTAMDPHVLKSFAQSSQPPTDE